jgi:hypothetical protein
MGYFCEPKIYFLRPCQAAGRGVFAAEGAKNRNGIRVYFFPSRKGKLRGRERAQRSRLSETPKATFLVGLKLSQDVDSYTNGGSALASLNNQYIIVKSASALLNGETHFSLPAVFHRWCFALRGVPYRFSCRQLAVPSPASRSISTEDLEDS